MNFVCPCYHHIVLLSNLTPATGNQTTAERIGKCLTNAGHDVTFIHSADFKNSVELTTHLSSLSSKTDFILGIHAFRSGRLLLGSFIPYAIILGGTDVNRDIHDLEKKDMIHSVLAASQSIIAFSKTMKDKLVYIFNDLENLINIIHPAVFIEKNFQINDSISTLLPCLASSPYISHQNSQIFLLVAGLRPIKDVSFLFDIFIKIHKEFPSTCLLIIGPILDQTYAKDIFSKIAGISKENQNDEFIMYHPPIDRNTLLSLKMNSRIIALINSSISEGVNNSILEAMLLGLPVLARDSNVNDNFLDNGNRSIINSVDTKKYNEYNIVKSKKDNDNIYNGILYQTTSDFYIIVNILIGNESLRKDLIKGGKTYIENLQNFECRNYVNVIHSLCKKK